MSLRRALSIAVALVTVNGVVVIVLLGFLFERPAFFFDIALAYALLAFILPIAISRYFEGRTLPSEEAHGTQPVPVDRGASDGGTGP